MSLISQFVFMLSSNLKNHLMTSFCSQITEMIYGSIGLYDLCTAWIKETYCPMN